MSDADLNTTPDDDSDIDAAEYVIGLLTKEEARAVEARAIADPSVARSILLWQERLSGLAQGVKPMPAPPQVWQRLEGAIMPAGLPVLDLAAFPQIPRQPRRARRRWPWSLGSRSAWLGGLVGAAGGAAFVVSIGAAVIGPKLYTSPPAIAALTSPDQDQPAYQVMLTRDGFATVVAVNPAFPADASLQLWTLDGATPVSLGLLPAKGRFRVQQKLVPGAKLLISQEPKGGSPEAGPTGRIVYSGNLIRG